MNDLVALFATMLAFTVTGFAAEPPISFQQIPKEETLEVTFSSRGCFHDHLYHFVFQPGKAATVKVSKTEAKREIPLGTVTLSNSQLAGLDRLMNFYRERRPGLCTTSDEIEVVRKRGGKSIAQESFKDDTCATYKMRGVMRFPEIVAKLEGKP